MGFNSGFKGLIYIVQLVRYFHSSQKMGFKLLFLRVSLPVATKQSDNNAVSIKLIFPR